MATFAYTPLYVWESTASHRVLVSELEGGTEQRKYKGAAPREWTLSFRAASSAIADIVAFFDARFQSTLPHGERPPSDTAKPCTSAFQSTLPHGERLRRATPVVVRVGFQSTLPHGERRDEPVCAVVE